MAGSVIGQIPGIGSFDNSSENNLENKFQEAGALTQQARGQQAQNYLNLLAQIRASYAPAHGALNAMYGPRGGAPPAPAIAGIQAAPHVGGPQQVYGGTDYARTGSRFNSPTPTPVMFDQGQSNAVNSSLGGEYVPIPRGGLGVNPQTLKPNQPTFGSAIGKPIQGIFGSR